jgi:acyl-CoA thioesterase-2
MTQILEQLIKILNVQAHKDGIYYGNSTSIGLPRVFGGQVIAQSLLAATDTIDGLLPHSLHAYFLKIGDPKEPIGYEVDRIRDGRSFATRRIVARQHGEAIFNMSCSYHVQEPGVEHQLETPEFPEGPENFKSMAQHRTELAQRIPQLAHFAKVPIPLDIRPVDFLGFINPEQAPATSMAWIKADGILPDDQIIQRGILAYVSDMGLLGTAARPHGVSFLDPSIIAASLDHSMWFHHDVNLNDWLLYTTDAPFAGSARAFTRGSFYDRTGKLVASTAQEGLVRKRSR